MEHPTNAQQVMGPAFGRPKVTNFSGNQVFPNWQQQLYNSFVSTQPNPMSSKSIPLFQELLQQIAYLETE